MRSVDGNTAEDVLSPEERSNLKDMIQSFTYNGAYANFLEGETGSTEVGKQACIVVLDQNLFDIAPQRKSPKQKSCSFYLLERRFLEIQSSPDKTIISFFVRCVLL